MIGKRRSDGGAEEPVGQRKGARVLPVIGDVRAIVESHRVIRVLSGQEPVHRAAVRRLEHRVFAVRQVSRSRGRQVEWRNPFHRQAERRPVGAGKGAEVVVERVILLEQVKYL